MEPVTVNIDIAYVVALLTLISALPIGAWTQEIVELLKERGAIPEGQTLVWVQWIARGLVALAGVAFYLGYGDQLAGLVDALIVLLGLVLGDAAAPLVAKSIHDYKAPSETDVSTTDFVEFSLDDNTVVALQEVTEAAEVMAALVKELSKFTSPPDLAPVDPASTQPIEFPNNDTASNITA